MSKLVNIQFEEGATFKKLLTFTKQVAKASGVHPITGVVTTTKVTEVIPLTGYRLVAQIKDRFVNPTFTMDLDATILDASKGMAMLGLSKENTARLAALVPKYPTGLPGNRTKKVGYYDVMAINDRGASTRLFYGECYLTRSVSVDPLLSVHSAHTFVESIITPITSPIIQSIDETMTKHYIGVRYYKGNIQVTPTNGTVELFKQPSTAPMMDPLPFDTLTALNSEDEAYTTGNLKAVKAVANNIQGADGYKLVVASNLY